MIDFHTHLDLYPNVVEVINDISARQMRILSVTTTPSAWEGTYALAADIPYIKTALGLHPQIAHERHVELQLFDKLIHKTKYIGEVGLDGGKEFQQYWNIQTSVFQHILKSCENLGGKILSIHSRHAVDEVLDYLEQAPEAGQFILHWFTGTKTQLRRAIKLGCWFSVGPAMLRSKRAKELILEIPITRLLTETDGPFVKINNRVVMPWDVSIAVEQLALILNMSCDDVYKIVNDNANILLG
ncbi:Qat anti-phage system TatD family nuclease QatD [Acinetobacter pittii]|uniref:Qat anti-phage system TatD family nuclease QatD n=1 Tax=Acinetobacter pittii TaxID=48296 RepID=UPI00102EEC90|nr:Qat anti-phage system TatD family nuclease QatD [Acinetobacter pittii]RZG95362.1 TatD family deoxyribonuclease [Acinetobacter pittii]